jgi:hypothetical protein
MNTRYLSVIYIFYYYGHRLKYWLTPGTAKLGESSQQSWGFADDYYMNKESEGRVQNFVHGPL